MQNDDLINKAIDEIIAKTEERDDNVKKRKPKPFRYLTDEGEIEAILSVEEKPHISVMKPPGAPKIVEDSLAIMGLGDIQAIENVIKRHEATRKFREK